MEWEVGRKSKGLGLSPDVAQSGAVELLEAPAILRVAPVGQIFESQGMDFAVYFLTASVMIEL